MSAQGIFLYYVPCPDLKVAKDLARLALQHKLAGCANILPQPMVSIYPWEGEVKEDNEVLLLLKTAEASAELEELIANNHPYDVPAIVGFKSASVNQKYLDFLKANSRD